MIVFSDLDGTLLDHDSYDFAPARPALSALAARNIPVILASSKTGPEIRVLQDRLDLRHWPAIVENGAGILAPGDVDADCGEYHRLRAALDALPDTLRAMFRGFGDVSDATVADWTGLPDTDAQLARQRAFTEPGLFSGTPQDEAGLVAALAQHGIAARRGGRFLTLSFGRTKADGLRTIADTLGGTPIVALGDAPNDRDMLLAADRAVIIRNEHGPDPGDIPGAIRTQLSGPAGWNAAIKTIMQEEGR